MNDWAWMDDAETPDAWMSTSDPCVDGYPEYHIYDDDDLEWGDGPYESFVDACDDATLFTAGAASYFDIPDSPLSVYGCTESGHHSRLITFPLDW